GALDLTIAVLIVTVRLLPTSFCHGLQPVYLVILVGLAEKVVMLIIGCVVDLRDKDLLGFEIAVVVQHLSDAVITATHAPAGAAVKVDDRSALPTRVITGQTFANLGQLTARVVKAFVVNSSGRLELFLRHTTKRRISYAR